MDSNDSTFQNQLPPLRRRAFSIAYRMLGSVAEAEDIVQESLLRLHRSRAEGAQIETPEAFISTIATRLAIDHLRLARVQRETYVGEWLPEPVVEESEGADGVELAESLSMAFLLLLETLTPVERAVFLLREAFDYGYDEIAEVVGKSEDNCRQIFSRAKRHIDAGKPRFEPSPRVRNEIARRFFEACQGGDLQPLVQMLAADATVYGDGGGKAAAIARPLRGGDRVAAFMRGIFAKGKLVGGEARLATVNGQPGAMLLDGERRLVAVMALEIVDGKVQSIRSVLNPDKLRHLAPLSEMVLLRRK